MSGIRLVLEEIRDLRTDSAEDRKSATAKDRRAEHDRDRWKKKWEKFAEDAAEDRREAAADRREFRRILGTVLRVARDFRAEQKKQTAILESHTPLLFDIARTVRAHGNGEGGNGSH